MTTESDPEAEAQKVVSLVNTARRLTAEGKMVDLSSLQRNVEALCDAIDRAQPQDAKGLKGVVSEILDELDALAEALVVQYESLTKELEVTVRGQALQAYGHAKNEA